jgi:hypothetical protein
MIAWRLFCTAELSVSGAGCEPTIPALPPPGSDGSNAMESCLDSSDLDGRVDCEKGVVGEVRPAAVLALPFACEGNDVES